MWTPTTRRQHSRNGLRYQTDLTDAEWAVIKPLMPAHRGNPPQGGGSCRPRAADEENSQVSGILSDGAYIVRRDNVPFQPSA